LKGQETKNFINDGKKRGTRGGINVTRYRGRDEKGGRRWAPRGLSASLAKKGDDNLEEAWGKREPIGKRGQKPKRTVLETRAPGTSSGRSRRMRPSARVVSPCN